VLFWVVIGAAIPVLLAVVLLRRVRQGSVEPTPWNADWERYYREADPIAVNQFDSMLALIGTDCFNGFDLSEVLDFATGHGRMAEHFARRAKKIICCDIQPASVEFCRQRFSNGRPNCTFDFLCNSLDGIALPNSSLTFVYSWDAMVHFDAAMLSLYFRDFSRVLRPGGKGLIHHSNYAGVNPGATTLWNVNPHCRASVSAGDVRALVEQVGMNTIGQYLMPWALDKDLDCLTVFQKPW
jgi:SAM-dependent methyltransferase